MQWGVLPSLLEEGAGSRSGDQGTLTRRMYSIAGSEPRMCVRDLARCLAVGTGSPCVRRVGDDTATFPVRPAAPGGTDVVPACCPRGWLSGG